MIKTFNVFPKKYLVDFLDELKDSKGIKRTFEQMLQIKLNELNNEYARLMNQRNKYDYSDLNDLEKSLSLSEIMAKNRKEYQKFLDVESDFFNDCC